ncbi:putative toxin-antitoxin system toxin component, PIN family [Halorutilales archaeon Cl-col2-1]
MESDEVTSEKETIEYFADFVLPDVEINEIEDDPSDNIFIEAAVSADADYIISGDSHLLSLHKFDGIEIVTPDEFLEEVVSGDG